MSDLDTIRDRHVEYHAADRSTCGQCDRTWPCDTRVVLDALDVADAASVDDVAALQEAVAIYDAARADADRLAEALGVVLNEYGVTVCGEWGTNRWPDCDDSQCQEVKDHPARDALRQHDALRDDVQLVVGRTPPDYEGAT